MPLLPLMQLISVNSLEYSQPESLLENWDLFEVNHLQLVLHP
jgi:hypothetical protein